MRTTSIALASAFSILAPALLAQGVAFPFYLPDDPRPGGSYACSSCFSSGPTGEAPHLNGDGSLALSIALGESPFIDAEGLLKVNLGFQMSYFPKDWFAIIPPGAPQGSKTFFIVREGPRKILFESKPDGEIDSIGVLSYNTPGLYLKREGESLLVSDMEKHVEHLYESVDAGNSWRIASIRRTNVPNVELKCAWSKRGELESFTLPGELKYTLSYRKDGQVAKLTGPDGETTEFTWDDRGMMKGLRTLIPPTHPLYPAKPEGCKLKKRESLAVRDIHCEMDSAGRLLALVGTSGERHTAEYRTDKDEKKKTVTISSVHTRPDGSKAFYETVKTPDDTRTIRIGALISGKDGKLEKDVAREFVMRKVRNTYVIFSKSLDGIETRLDYSNAAEEDSATDSLGNATKYVRNAKGLALSKVNPDGTDESYSYDSSGRVVLAADKFGRETKTEYDQQGRVTAWIPPDGPSARYEYGDNWLKETKSDGSARRYEWDSKRRLTSRVNPNGVRVEWTYKGSLFSPFSISLSSPDGQEKFSCDYSYDPQGRLTKILYSDGSSDSWKYGCCDALEYRDRAGNVTKWAYDAANRKVLEVSPKGEKTSYAYDHRGRLVKVVFPDRTFEQVVYGQYGKVSEKTFRDGKKVSYEYDKAGRKVKEASQGNLTEIKYDSMGRILSISGTQSNVEYSYDSKGKLLSISDFGSPRRDAPSVTSFEYDSKGRQSKVKYPDGTVSIHFFDNFVRTDGVLECGFLRRYGYDSMGRIETLSVVPEAEFRAAKTPEEKNALYQKYLTERRVYGLDGSLAERRDGQGRLRAKYLYRYDGREAAVIRPLSGSGAVKETFSYVKDVDGSMEKLLLARKTLDGADLSAKDWKQ